MYHKVIIYDWPYSQTCMGCEHGEFVESKTYGSSNLICSIGSTGNNGSECRDRKEVTVEPHK